MTALKRALVAVTMMALAFGLTALPSSTAHAAAGDASCIAAQQTVKQRQADVTKAKAKKKTTKKKVKVKKKAVKKAKTTTKTKKAKKQLKKAKKKFKKAKKQLKTKKAQLSSAQATQSARCAPAPTANADLAGRLLGLFTQGAGQFPSGLPDDFSPTDVLALLAGLGGLGGELPTDPADLLALFESFGGDIDVDQLTAIFEGFVSSFPVDGMPFDPSMLTEILNPSTLAGLAALFGGQLTELDPAMLADLLVGLMGQFGDIPGAGDFPLDPGLVVNLLETLGETLGDLLGDLLGLGDGFGDGLCILPLPVLCP